MISVGKKLFLGCATLLMLNLLSGCYGGSGSSGSMEPIKEDSLSQVTTMVESYGDIELPLEMILEPEKSMAMRTDSFQGGIHIYRGRVQIASLRDYIIASMRNHKWKLVGEASYKNVMLAFTKPNRTCMVVLSEDSTGVLGKTQANFYVTVDVAAANRLNPFGEPVTQ
ncbi:MAG: hypothetical protein VR65_10140 [Desulfobulbaceae bacterium BRH_c16a]|nr:MAG: hypothetical protein VR65_10140 [Desulfobulbaceae bacterium BRH_c16a]